MLNILLHIWELGTNIYQNPSFCFYKVIGDNGNICNLLTTVLSNFFLPKRYIYAALHFMFIKWEN